TDIQREASPTSSEKPQEHAAGRLRDIREVVAAEGPSRGVAAGRSAQRGTSGAATGGGGPQAPPTRTRDGGMASTTRSAPPTRTRASPTRKTFIEPEPAVPSYGCPL